MTVTLQSVVTSAIPGPPERDPDPPLELPPLPTSARLEAFSWLGRNCFNWDQTPPILNEYRLHIPLRNWLKRESSIQNPQGFCQFTAILRPPKGTRIVIQSFAGQSVMNLAPGASGRVKAELIVHLDGKIRIEDLQTTWGSYRQTLTRLFDEAPLAGQCDQSLTLHALTETRLEMGSDTSSVKIEQMEIDYVTEPCDR